MCFTPQCLKGVIRGLRNNFERIAKEREKIDVTQLIFTCSKSTTETLEKKCEICSHQNNVVLVFLLTLNIFHTFFLCFYC